MDSRDDRDHLALDARADEDLREIANGEAGRAVLLRLVKRLRGTGFVSCDPAAVALHNAGEDILADLVRVAPDAYLKLIAALAVETLGE